MRGPHNILRLIRTGATLERTGAMPVILNALDAPRTLKFAARFIVWPFQFLGRRGDQSLPPAPRALTAMGPAYIKFGQILSTRPDVVGPELAEQLRVLQDRLPPSLLMLQSKVLSRRSVLMLMMYLAIFQNPLRQHRLLRCTGAN